MDMLKSPLQKLDEFNMFSQALKTLATERGNELS